MSSLPAWHPDHVPPAGRLGSSLLGGGRRPSQQEVPRETASDLVQKGSIRQAFVDAHTFDKTEVPRTPEGLLDVERVLTELRRVDWTGGPRGVTEYAHAPRLSSIVMSRTVWCLAYDMAMWLAGDVFATCGGRFEAMDWSRLVGRLVPIMGQAPPKVKESRAGGTVFDPVPMGDSPPPHHFFGRVVALTTDSDTKTKYDAGEILALGVVVSPRAFNYPPDHERRLSLGVVNKVFEETWAYVLVVHAYAPYVAYAELNRGVKDRPRRTEDHPYEGIFKWEAYAAANASCINEPLYRICRSGLAGCKMTTKALVRTVVPWSIAAVGGELASMRARGELDSLLVEMPMVQAEKGMKRRRVLDDIGGLDLRRMLLVELLIRGTPLEPLLRGAGNDVRFDFEPPTVPSASCMFDTLLHFASST